MRGSRQNQKLLDVQGLANSQYWKKHLTGLKEFWYVGIVERPGSGSRRIQSMRSTDPVIDAGSAVECSIVRSSRLVTQAVRVNYGYPVTAGSVTRDLEEMTFC